MIKILRRHQDFIEEFYIDGEWVSNYLIPNTDAVDKTKKVKTRMIKITAEDKQFDFPESWDEVNFSQYVKLTELEQNKNTFISPVLWEIKFLEILCNAGDGELDTLTDEDLKVVEPILKDSLTPEKLNSTEEVNEEYFIINGITYAFYTQETLKSITLGEQAYLESLKSSTSLYDTIVKAAAVMIRPATQKTTKEGFKRWKLDRFKASDIEDRAKLFEAHLSVKHLMTMNSFFLSGSNE